MCELFGNFLVKKTDVFFTACYSFGYKISYVLKILENSCKSGYFAEIL